ncbi:MAG: DUF983 domain-containing protein, partial [Hydrogenophaga sp.]
LKRRCPSCGIGQSFRGYLQPVDSCRHCGEPLGHIRADDMPAYMTIFLVGHIVVPGALMVEKTWAPELWIQMSLWPTLALVLTMAFLPYVKGACVGLMWALGLRGRSRGVLAGLSLVGLAWLAWSVGPNVTRLQDDTAAATVATSVQGVRWEPWSPQRQADLLAEGRPVFIDFTAAWCVTCQYNKRTTLSDETLLADMASRNVALLRADWTRRDPAVTEALARLGRNGIPVYAIYKNGQAPQVLSEIITVEEVRVALTRL